MPISTFSVFIVHNIASITSWTGPLGNGAVNAVGFSLLNDVSVTTAYTPHLTVFSAGAELYNKKTDYSVSVPTSTMLLYWDSSLTMYLNSTAKTVSDGTTSFGRAASVGQGRPALFVGMDLCEILIYNAVLSASQRQAVESYLNTKWAVY